MAKGIHIEDRFHPFLLDFSIQSFPEWLFCSSCQCSLGGKCVDFSLGCYLYVVEIFFFFCHMFMKYLALMYILMLLLLPDDHREKLSKSNAPFMREDQCCIGGVDFVTLVCEYWHTIYNF